MAKIGRNSSYVYVPQFLRDIRKECTHMKKRFLSTLMALVLALSLVPTAALAAGEEVSENEEIQTLANQTVETAEDLSDAITNAQSGDTITLGSDIALSSGLTVDVPITLDLNGYTLSADTGFTTGYLITITMDGALTLTDSDGNGEITRVGRAIRNQGSFYMDSGTIAVTSASDGSNYGYGVLSDVTKEAYEADRAVVCEIGGTAVIDSDVYGVVFLGAGMAGQTSGSQSSIHSGDAGSVRNDLMQVSISGNARIEGCQAIGTNASNGIYAGFTLDISDDAEVTGTPYTFSDGIDAGCAMYLPAVGVTTISGGTIGGGQGIRICAGELNITGGTIQGTTVGNNQDLIAGGSGGTQGAIVVGKAGGGYVGDVVVYISADVVVENIATPEDEDVLPAIVVSDKNMSGSNYSDNSITVTVDGAEISGDVVKVSNLTANTTQDGGNTTLTIQDATVTGNVTNQSQTGLIIRDTIISGNVSNTSNGSTAVLGSSTISGSHEATGSGTIYYEKGESTETYYAINERTSKVYTDLNKAISEASDGDTITLLDDIEVSLDGIDNTSGAITIDKSITLNGDGNTITATSTGSEKGIAHIIVVSGSEVTIEKLNLNGNKQIARYGIQAYGEGTELTLDTVNSYDNYAYSFFANDAEVVATNVTTSGNGWGGVNVDNGGKLTVSSGTFNDEYSVVIEGTDNEATLNGGTYENIQVKTTGDQTNTLTITGGEYKDIVGDDKGGSPKANQTTVKGGTFKNSVKQFADDTVAYELNDSGTYSYHKSLEDALDAAKSDSATVTKIGETETPVTYYEVIVNYGNSQGTVTEYIKDNTQYKLPSAPSSRPGYTFDGWLIYGNRYQPGATITIDGPKTIDADWNEVSSSGGSSSEPSYSPVMDVSKGGSVKVNPRTPGEGDEVTITVDPDRGYEVGDVTVTDRSGRDVRVTAERDGTYTFEQPKGRVTIAVTFVREGTSTFFTDVAETYWAYDEIAWAYENGYVNGVTATTFAPGASISRQQIWMILARIAGDDPADMAAARQWSIDNGISDGTNPGSAVTRQQLAALLYRYAQMMGYANEARVDLSSFPDAGSVASYAVEPMQWSVANSIVGGTTDGTLNPTGTATRAQFAVMLYRFWTGV